MSAQINCLSMKVYSCCPSMHLKLYHLCHFLLSYSFQAAIDMTGHFKQLISSITADLLLGNVHLPPLVQAFQGFRCANFLSEPVASLLGYAETCAQ